MPALRIGEKESSSDGRQNSIKTTVAALLRGLFSKHGDRGAVRLRRAGISGLTSVLAQILSIAASLVSIPLTVRYLGPERYGVWLTMGSAFSWLAITDLGFGGNALVNVLAEADGKGDPNVAQGFVATAFWCLVLIAMTLGLAFACAFPFVSWTAVFNVSSSVAAHELRLSLVLLAAIFVVTLPLGVVSATYRAYQQGYIANFWEITASIFSLLGVIVVTRLKGGLPQLVLALSGARLLVIIANALYLFKYRYPWLLPRPRLVKRRLCKRLLSLGIKYLLNQLAIMGCFQSQPMIVTHVLGPSQVGIFTISQRLLILPCTLVYLLTFPLLSAFSEAKARDDWKWIWQTLKRYLLGSVALASVMVVIMGSVARPLVRIWAGPALVPTASLVAGLGIYALVASVATPTGILLYGLEHVGGLAIMQTVQAVLSILLCIRFAESMGLVGIAIAMVISFVAVNWVGQALQIRQIVIRNRHGGLKEAVRVA
jgi:O-antigen/teichoic acid export membrane protein